MSRRGNGEGTVYFDTDRERWVGQADAGLNPITGKRRRVKVVGQPGESKSAVASRLRNRIFELSTQNPSAPRTVGELVAAWRSRTAPKRRSVTTLAMTDSLISNHIEPVFGSIPVGALTVEDVEVFLDARAGSHAKSTLEKLRTILAQSYDFGVRRRHVSWNPARIAELPPGASTKRVGRALSATESRALLNVATDHRLGAWVVVAMTLGLRPGEVSGLTWEAADLDAGSLVVFQSLAWPGKKPVLKDTKTKRGRTLELPAITVNALRSHRKTQAEERLLAGDLWPHRWSSLCFVTQDGTPLDPANIRRVVARLGQQADIEGSLTPYDLRHTATTLIADAGLSADRLADLLGHKDTRMVFGHYRHREGITISTAAEYWGA